MDPPLARSRPRAAASRRGVSLPELLVVIAVLALAMMISIPLIADRVHHAKLGAAASQYAVSLRAARMIAVSKQTPVTVSVLAVDQAYEYLDAMGRLRRTKLPEGVQIDDAESDDAIVFNPNGSLGAPARTVMKSTVSGGVDASWTIDVPVSGIPEVRRDP